MVTVKWCITLSFDKDGDGDIFFAAILLIAYTEEKMKTIVCVGYDEGFWSWKGDGSDEIFQSEKVL